MKTFRRNAEVIVKQVKEAEAYLNRQVSRKDTSAAYAARISAVLSAYGADELQQEIEALETKKASKKGLKASEQEKLARAKDELLKVELEAKTSIDAIKNEKAANRAVGLADWLSKKGFEALFDSQEVVVTYGNVAERLAVAAKIAANNVAFMATVLGGTVSHSDYTSMQPDSVLICKKEVPFGSLDGLLVINDDDEEIIKTAKEKALGIWNQWMDATVPGIRKGLLAYRGRFSSEAELCRLCLYSTTKEVNDIIDSTGAEVARSYAAYINDGSFRMAAWLMKHCCKDTEAAEKKLKELKVNGGVDAHLMAVAAAKLYNAANQGLEEPVRWGFDNGIPVAPSDEELIKFFKLARSAAEMADEESNKRAWSWDFQANFYSHLVDENIVDYETLADLVGLLDAIVKVGIANNSGTDAEISERYYIAAGREMKANLEFAKKFPSIKACRPWGSRFSKPIEVYAGGKVRTTKSPLTAYYLERGEHFGIFADPRKLESIERNLDWAAYCWITAEQAENWSVYYAHDAMKKFIKKAYRVDELACLPDGELFCTQAPRFTKPGKDPRKGIDTTVFLTYDKWGDAVGDNLYGKVLAELRDEARAEIDSAKESEVPEDLVKSAKSRIAALLESKRK